MRVINRAVFLRLGNMSCLGEAFPGFGSGKISFREVSLYRDSFSTQAGRKLPTSLSVLAEDRCASPQRCLL